MQLLNNQKESMREQVKSPFSSSSLRIIPSTYRCMTRREEGGIRKPQCADVRTIKNNTPLSLGSGNISLQEPHMEFAVRQEVKTAQDAIHALKNSFPIMRVDFDRIEIEFTELRKMLQAQARNHIPTVAGKIYPSRAGHSANRVTHKSEPEEGSEQRLDRIFSNLKKFKDAMIRRETYVHSLIQNCSDSHSVLASARSSYKSILDSTEKTLLQKKMAEIEKQNKELTEELHRANCKLAEFSAEPRRTRNNFIPESMFYTQKRGYSMENRDQSLLQKSQENAELKAHLTQLQFELSKTKLLSSSSQESCPDSSNSRQLRDANQIICSFLTAMHSLQKGAANHDQRALDKLRKDFDIQKARLITLSRDLKKFEKDSSLLRSTESGLFKKTQTRSSSSEKSFHQDPSLSLMQNKLKEEIEKLIKDRDSLKASIVDLKEESQKLEIQNSKQQSKMTELMQSIDQMKRQNRDSAVEEIRKRLLTSERNEKLLKTSLKNYIQTLKLKEEEIRTLREKQRMPNFEELKKNIIQNIDVNKMNFLSIIEKQLLKFSEKITSIFKKISYFHELVEENKLLKITIRKKQIEINELNLDKIMLADNDQPVEEFGSRSCTQFDPKNIYDKIWDLISKWKPKCTKTKILSNFTIKYGTLQAKLQKLKGKIKIIQDSSHLQFTKLKQAKESEIRKLNNTKNSQEKLINDFSGKVEELQKTLLAKEKEIQSVKKSRSQQTLQLKENLTHKQKEVESLKAALTMKTESTRKILSTHFQSLKQITQFFNQQISQYEQHLADKLLKLDLSMDSIKLILPHVIYLALKPTSISPESLKSLNYSLCSNFINFNSLCISKISPIETKISSLLNKMESLKKDNLKHKSSCSHKIFQSLHCMQNCVNSLNSKCEQYQKGILAVQAKANTEESSIHSFKDESSELQLYIGLCGVFPTIRKQYLSQYGDRIITKF